MVSRYCTPWRSAVRGPLVPKAHEKAVCREVCGVRSVILVAEGMTHVLRYLQECVPWPHA